MSVADRAREMAQRYIDDAGLIAGWARTEVFKRLKPTMRQPAHMDELCTILRRVVEDQAVEHFTIAELAALARFYATAEGTAALRKTAAFRGATAPVLVAEVSAWVRAVGVRVGVQPSPREATP